MKKKQHSFPHTSLVASSQEPGRLYAAFTILRHILPIACTHHHCTGGPKNIVIHRGRMRVLPCYAPRYRGATLSSLKR